jgi:cytochrome P450
MSLASRIPGPVSAGIAFRENPLAFLRSLDDGSEVMRFRAGVSEFFVVNDPESIHRILVTDAERFGEGKWTLRGKRVMGDCLITREGTPHRERRRLLQPGFERSHLEPKANAVASRARRLSAGWSDGRRIEMRAEMAKLALGAAADVLFSLRLDDRSDDLVPALMTMLAEIPRPGPPLRSGRRLAAARRVVDAHVPAAIAARRNGHDRGPERHDDVLGLLLGEGRNGEPGPEAAIREAAAADELVSLLIASIDTTPGTLAWCWYLLARHPEVEQRLWAELGSTLGEGQPTVADLPRLGYLDQVISEVLRLYPPVHFIDRRPLEDTEIGGVRIRAGSYILLSPLLTQRDERHFEQPDSFQPARWDRKAGHPRYSYFPFGGGPHTCIGMFLAKIELALVIATLAGRWRPVPTDDFPLEPTPNLSGFPMVVRRRD